MAAGVFVDEIVDDLFPESLGTIEDVVLDAQFFYNETRIADGIRLAFGGCRKVIDLAPQT